uniref:DNA internalization-related competence protein ComEC/Rec2 n=1 Tax=Desulfacinum infernum TaxID=35837 RepID=A0A832A8K0_9BACT
MKTWTENCRPSGPASGGKRNEPLLLGSRPLAPLAVALASGIGLAHALELRYTTPPILAAAALLSASALAATLLKKSHRFWRYAAAVFLCAAVGCLGAALWAHSEKKAVPPPSLESFLDGSERLYRGTIRPYPDFYPDAVVFPVALHAVWHEGHWQPLPAGVRVTVRRPVREWRVGDGVAMPLALRPFVNFENPGRYDYVANQARKGFFARASIKSDLLWNAASFRPPEELGIHRAVDRLRRHLREILTQSLDGPQASAAQALFLGYRNAVSPLWQDRFQKAGVMHLLAISGLHVGLVAWAAFRLTQIVLRAAFPRLLLRIPDIPLAWGIGAAAAAMYGLLAGLAIPTQRALISFGCAVAALVLYRRPDPLSMVSAAALLILLNAPQSLFGASFQLSFAAFLGIVAFYPPWTATMKKVVPALFRGRLRLVRPFVDAFLLCAAASVAVSPLVAYHFQGLSAAGLAANTLVVPFLAFAVLPPGLAALGLSTLHPSAGPILLAPMDFALRGLLWLIERFAAWPYAFASTGPVPLWLVTGLYTALLLLAAPMPRVRKAVSLAAVALFTALWGAGLWKHRPFPEPPLFQVTALDVGQGSATVVRCPQGGVFLVDGGGFYDDSFDVGRHVVAPALWAMGIRRLDAVILSHDHPDHRNGLRFILETFPVRRYVETGLGSRGLTGSSLVAVAIRRRIPTVQTLVDGPKAWDDTVDLGDIGGCRLRALHPTREFIQTVWDAKNLNEASLVLEVSFGEAGVLIPGDIGEATEEGLLGRLTAGVHHWILIAPHHGSATSCGGNLLERLRPDGVLLSCGFGNPFGFPAPAVLERLQSRRVPVLRTDLHGAVHASWDGSRWVFSPTLPRRSLVHSRGGCR